MILKKIAKLLAVILLGLLLGGYFFLGEDEIGKFSSRFVSIMDKAGLPVKDPNSVPLITKIIKVPPIPVADSSTEAAPITPLEQLEQQSEPVNNDNNQLNSSEDSSVPVSAETSSYTTAHDAQVAMTPSKEPSSKNNSVKTADDVMDSALSGDTSEKDTSGEPDTKESQSTSSMNAPLPSEPVIVFTSANKRLAGNALRGEISSTVGNPLPLVQQDGIIPLSFIDDIASFLVINYWIKGTHPSAIDKDFSTITLGWVNSRYSDYFVNKSNKNIDPVTVREKILSYALKPVMVNALSSLYQERLIDSLVRAGYSRFGQDAQGVQHISGMLSFYSLRVKSVASAIKGYIRYPEARQKSEALINAEARVQEAYRKYNEVRFSNSDKGSLAYRSAVKKYQNAIWTRDQAKMRVASVMRRAGDTRYLSEDELDFVALWITRRDQSYYEGLSTFAGVLNSLSAQMNAKAQFLGLENRLSQ